MSQFTFYNRPPKIRYGLDEIKEFITSEPLNYEWTGEIDEVLNRVYDQNSRTYNIAKRVETSKLIGKGINNFPVGMLIATLVSSKEGDVINIPRITIHLKSAIETLLSVRDITPQYIHALNNPKVPLVTASNYFTFYFTGDEKRTNLNGFTSQNLSEYSFDYDSQEKIPGDDKTDINAIPSELTHSYTRYNYLCSLSGTNVDKILKYAWKFYPKSIPSIIKTREMLGLEPLPHSLNSIIWSL